MIGLLNCCYLIAIGHLW